VSVNLIGREAEWERLEAAVDAARDGSGRLVLLAGDAGMGKTALAEELAAAAGGAVLRGTGAHGATPPYGPLATALRPHLREQPRGIDACGALRPQLALVLPELGDPPADPDPGALVEAVRCALRATAEPAPLVVLLDDLHRSDEATLDVLAGLARPLTELPVVVVAAYRSDETPRGHPLRRLRDELRRQGELQEIAVGPLERDATAALTYRCLGEAPSPALARIVHDRTQGVPFFVEELCAVLREGDRVQPGKRGVDLAGEADVPVPETIRDAVLLRTASLSEDARAAADVAAVSGPRFDAVVVAELAGEGAVEELLARAC
jgi:predicted ATPase